MVLKDLAAREKLCQNAEYGSFAFFITKTLILCYSRGNSDIKI